MTRQGVRVEKIIDEVVGVRSFRLRLSDTQDFTFVPGQFVMISFPDDPKTKRAYSISSSPLDRGFIDITLNRVGEFTTRLFSLKGAEDLCIDGPYGKFVYRESEAPHAVLISGGTGITPYRSMARYVIQKKLPNKVTILYSARVPNEIIFYKEFLALAREHSNIKYYVTITRPHLLAPGDLWKGPVGRLHVEAIRQEVPDFLEAVYFLCGPNQLVNDLLGQLRGVGVNEDNIHFEKWGEF